MANILVNFTNGPEYKTKASIAFILVKLDINYDHSVAIFSQDIPFGLIKENRIEKKFILAPHFIQLFKAFVYDFKGIKSKLILKKNYDKKK